MAYRYRLYPTRAQEQLLLQTAGSCRFVYNKALALRNTVYQETGKAPSVNDLVKAVTGFKKDHPFLKQALSQPLQQAVRDMHRGWLNFFEGRAARPTWRKFADAPSFRLPEPGHFKIKNLPGTKKNRRHLFLPKMGMSGQLGPVEMVVHRPLEGKVKNATISREGTAWYVSFCVAIKGTLVKRREERAAALQATVRAGGLETLRVTGLDRNVARNGAVVSNWGEVYGVVIKTKRREQKQARLQRVVARKEEALRKVLGFAPGGSLKGVERPNHLKAAQARLRKFSAKVARIRKDVAHRISRLLVDNSDVLVLEALDTKAMTSSAGDKDALPWECKRDKQTRKDILDVGWAMIEGFVCYKAAKAGKRVVRVSPAYTSQTCSACGHCEKKNRLSAVVFRCVACGHEMDANVNAAWNIRGKGLDLLRREIQCESTGERPELSCLCLEEPEALGKGEQRSTCVGEVLPAPPTTAQEKDQAMPDPGSLGF